jgi:hypothetical protein
MLPARSLEALIAHSANWCSVRYETVEPDWSLVESQGSRFGNSREHTPAKPPKAHAQQHGSKIAVADSEVLVPDEDLAPHRPVRRK